MKEIKSNIRWAGGKSKMIPILDKYMPTKIDNYLEIFTGGASVLLHVIQKYKPQQVIANDINSNLINYYKNIQNNSESIISKCKEIKEKYNKDSFKEKFDKLDIKKAEEFFIKNKTSFSGLNTTYSPLAYDKNFTYNSIKNIKDISNVIQQVNFINQDFKDIKKEIKDFFIYLDPPYYSNSKKGLYGEKGKLHKDFDHIALYEWIEKNKEHNKIMISYDDCQYIRELYKDYYIYNFDFYYSMTNVGGNECKIGKEIVITNYDINKQNGEQLSIFDILWEEK